MIKVIAPNKVFSLDGVDLDSVGAVILYGTSPASSVTFSEACINLSWSGYRNGEYEEHGLAERPIDTSRFFPTGLKKVGDKADALYADHYDTVIGAVDLGTQQWTWQETWRAWFTPYLDMNALISDASKAPNIKHVSLDGQSVAVITNPTLETAGIAFAKNASNVKQSRIIVRNGSDSVQPTGILYYELATPTTTEIDPPLNLSYKVSDFGTERIMVDETADAPQSAPVPMDVEYGINATDTVRRLPTQYISHESFQQFVAALQSAVGITVTETWDENDGRYEYTVTQTGE